ncbi:translation initiation factor IF-2 [Nisaea sediminum]|uniref:translation initiation factor IF-2 n=1 Tax=Nisaea sediminum TaxID=2775867 RepID=UPI001867B30E|nr:translation initiation factor IF-2 [Nisaea sediminum]
MTTSNETDRKKLSLSGRGKLSLGKSVDKDQVKQSFSHGRSKTVQVERRRKRVGGPGGPGGAGDSGGLSAEERERRTRALKEGLKQQEAARTEASELTTAAEQAQPATEAAPEPAPDAAPEPVDRRQAELEEMRRIADAEGKERQEEAARLAEEAAAREAKAQAERAATRPTEPRNQPDRGPAAAAAPAMPEEDSEGRRSKRRGGGGGAGAPDRRAAPTPSRRGEQRRRSGKLTVSQALDDRGGERSRSLASVRRAREREKQRMREEGGEQAKQVREVVIPDAITVQELANRMAERAGDVIKTLMKMGMMATITQSIDSDTAELVVAEFGHKAKRVSESDVELQLQVKDDAPEDLKPRAPVVTVMGHVDHGKTSLLDALRRSDVAAGEAGGITQHIGAYQVTVPSGAKITFLDTPGHEAFTEMRARGANVTDIVVLVVAADDGIMAQTVEAIRHAKAAGCPIIVAVNKCDLPDADPNRVRQELLQHEIVVEEMGGDVLAVDVSAKTKQGLDKLEEAILLQAELLEVKANPDRRAEGAVVEAKMEKGRGSVATVLIIKGTLNVGDIFVAGAEWGRVRALLDDHGQRIQSAGPSMPVEVLGLQGTPVAGDEFGVVETEGQAREIAEYRQRVLREKSAVAGARGSVEQMLSAIAAGQAEELPVVIKTDVHGSLEAIRSTLEKISNDQVAVRILHGAVGGISESDVSLAKASGALIIGFNVRAVPQARDLAAQEGLEIRYYSIIYELIDDIKAALTGMLSPDLKEEFLGNAEIREVFNITKVGKVGGCMVTEGMLRRAAKVRLLRDNVVIHEGTLKTLKRFKDEVKEVREGYECGAAFENYNDIQVGDFIECFEVKEVARSLESVQQASTSS